MRDLDLGYLPNVCFINWLIKNVGPGLVFVVYPEGLSQMPISPLWGILFFFMILLIGLDTQFAMLEAVIIGFADEYKILERKKTLFTLIVCIIACLFGISMVTQVSCKYLPLNSSSVNVKKYTDLLIYSRIFK